MRTHMTTFLAGLALAGLCLLPAGCRMGFDGAPDGKECTGTTVRARTVATGMNHSCSLTEAGGVRCWGENGDGQLGDGTTLSREEPVDVSGLASGARAVVVGDHHSCASLDSGAVVCWGDGSDGQLGDGTAKDKHAPSTVIGLGSNATQVDAGYYRTCAVTASGGVHCWGYNKCYGLGTYAEPQADEPVPIEGLSSGIRAVAVASHHSCALTSGGGVKCWGCNGSGQLGDGTWDDRQIPVEVAGLGSGVTAIAIGSSHSCALLESGGIRCWGANGYGQLGDGTTDEVNTPVPVLATGRSYQAIALGDNHSCALTGAGGVECWGENWAGQLGEGSTQSSSRPVPLPGLESGVTDISAGWSNTCARLKNGALKCWGSNTHQQLGTGSPSCEPSPVSTPELSTGITEVSAGGHHTCAVDDSGGLWCMGYNSSGQLGLTDKRASAVPVEVSGLGGAQQVSAGGDHTCALTTGGAVKCFGRNDYGSLGDGTGKSSPTPVNAVGLTSGVRQVDCGGEHTCALNAAGGVECWGANGHGQLGDGTTTERLQPVDVIGLTTGATFIAAGGSGAHTCAVTTAGTVQCWGENGDGQLGDGTTADKSQPVAVNGLTGALAVAAGDMHTCALTTAGGVECWGYGGYGQLGDGTWNWSGATSPVGVSGLSSGVVAISAGDLHTCALTFAGQVKCWGGNEWGQLGDGTRENRSAPIAAAGLEDEVVAISAGGFHTCALTATGQLSCWGHSGWGQLGEHVAWSTDAEGVLCFGP